MKNNSFKDSFYHALSGIIYTFRTERNMKVHVIMTIAVITCAVLFKLTPAHKAIVISLCAFVISTELLNTAIENVADMLAPTYNVFAKHAKDASAGATLAASVGAAIAGLIIFVPYALRIIF